MKSIFYNSQQNHLNEIEYFVDDICERLNLSNSLYGNILISITETVEILKRFTNQGRVSISGDQSELNICFDRFVHKPNTTSIFDNQLSNIDLNNDDDLGIFMVNALSDDILINNAEESITCVFKNKRVEKEVSQHRKNFLKKYLHQEIATNV